MNLLKLLTVLLLNLTIINFAFGQNCHVIEFDFSTKNIVNPKILKEIKNGDLVSVKVTNFNPYLYQAQISFSDSTIPINTAPGLFSSFFSVSDLSTITGNLNSHITKIFPGIFPPAPAGHGLLSTRNDSIQRIERIILDHKNRIIQRQIDLTNLIQTAQTFVFDTDIYILAVKKWNLKSSNIIDFTASDQTSFYQTVTGFASSRNAIHSSLMVEIGTYESEVVKFGRLIKSETTLRTSDSLIRLSNKEMLQGLTSFDTTFTFAKFEQILAQLINIQKDNFTYTSFPTQVKADLTKVDFTVSPWSTSSNLSSYKASWQFPLKQKSYFSFSTAFFLSGLHDNEYYAEQKVSSSNDTSYLITKENSSNVEVGVSALFHYGWYLKNGNSDVSFHFAFGPGLTIQKNPLPRLIAGVGLGFGRKNKVVLNTGVIAGEVQRIRSYYESNPSVGFSPTDVTTSKLKASVFFAIGYTIL
jgi:hypothetical protein